MTTPSPQPDERARKNLATILQALATVTQVKVAERLRTSESTVHRTKDDATEFARFLSACGLKVVPEHTVCVEPAYLAGCENFARRWLEHVTKAQDAEGSGAPPALKWD